MRANGWAILAGSLCLVLFGARQELVAAPPAKANQRDQMTQASLINSLMLGQYDGKWKIKELLEWGDFGLGTLDHLDGELIVLDGQVFQVRGDGKVLKVSPEQTTPFAVMTFFQPEGTFSCPNLSSLAALDRFLERSIPKRNLFVSLRIEARFDSITLRSVQRQEPPYKPLAEVAKSQSVWTHKQVEGTLIGIRSPAWSVGLNVPGTHWHFLSRDRSVGGHVLDCTLQGGEVKYDLCRNWSVKLDDSPALDKLELESDLSRDLKRVESSRGSDDAPQSNFPERKKP